MRFRSIVCVHLYWISNFLLKTLCSIFHSFYDDAIIPTQSNQSSVRQSLSRKILTFFRNEFYSNWKKQIALKFYNFITFCNNFQFWEENYNLLLIFKWKTILQIPRTDGVLVQINIGVDVLLICVHLSIRILSLCWWRVVERFSNAVHPPPSQMTFHCDFE